MFSEEPNICVIEACIDKVRDVRLQACAISNKRAAVSNLKVNRNAKARRGGVGNNGR